MLGLQLYNYTSKLIKDPIYLLEFVEGMGQDLQKFPQRSAESPIWRCFWKMVLCSHLWSALYFVFFPLSQFNLHAASILQSILLNRLQCVLLSVPLSLYLTGCGSPVHLNHIQVSVRVDACYYGLVPTPLNVKETNLTSSAVLSLKSLWWIVQWEFWSQLCVNLPLNSLIQWLMAPIPSTQKPRGSLLKNYHIKMFHIHLFSYIF